MEGNNININDIIVDVSNDIDNDEEDMTKMLGNLCASIFGVRDEEEISIQSF